MSIVILVGSFIVQQAGAFMKNFCSVELQNSLIKEPSFFLENLGSFSFQFNFSDF